MSAGQWGADQMGVAEALKDRPIIPGMQQGLELIWAFLGDHCPAELAAYEAAFPDRRLNLERVNMPAVAQLLRHKKALNAWVQFQAHTIPSHDFNGGLFNYTQQVKKHLAGAPADIHGARAKLVTSDALACAAKPDAEMIAKTGDRDLVRLCDETVFSPEIKELHVHHHSVMAIKYEGMSVEAFEAELSKLEQNYACKVEESL